MYRGIHSILAACALALSACATKPAGQSKPADADNIFAPKLLEPGPGKGMVTLKRDRGFIGSACAISISFDGREVVRLKQGQSITVHILAGEYLLGAETRSVCGGGLREALVVVSPEKPRAYRVGFGSAMDFFLLPTSVD